LDGLGARKARRIVNINLRGTLHFSRVQSCATWLQRPDKHHPATDDLGPIALIQARPALELLRTDLCFETIMRE